jgi:hypothetical protein
MCLTGLDMYQGPIDYEAIDDDGIECKLPPKSDLLLRIHGCLSVYAKGRMVQPSIGW